jgi:tetratricopeptide (TPR) repeat protein
MMRVRRALPLVATLVIVATPTVAARTAASARDPWKQNAALISRADDLFVAGRLDACGALLDSTVAAAAIAHNRGLERVARIRRARLEVLHRRTVEARQDLQIALADARAAANTLSECRGLVVLGTVEALDPDPTTQSARRALALASRVGLRDEQAAAWSAIGLADLSAQRFDAATADYRHALDLLRHSSDWRAAMIAHNGLERCLIASNDFVGARREHAIVMREALRHGDLVQQSESWNHLGVLEHSGGNPAEAERCYVRAAVMSRSIGWTTRAVYAERNLALLYVNIGRAAQSESVLTHALPEAEHAGDPMLKAFVYSQLGVAYRQLQRYGDAEAFGRRAVALSDSVNVWMALQFTSTLTGTLQRVGKLRDALELVEGQRVRLDSRLSDRDRANLDAQRADLLLALGRPREAIAALRTNVTDTPAVAGLDGYLAIEARDHLARCYRALAERDSALELYRDATARWEVARRGVTDKTWREGLDNIATDFSARYAALLLDPAHGGTADSRAREAFDMLQRFRAGPGGARSRPAADSAAGSSRSISRHSRARVSGRARRSSTSTPPPRPRSCSSSRAIGFRLRSPQARPSC